MISNTIAEPDGTKVVKLSLSYKEMANGWVKRAYHPTRKHLEMRDSHFESGFPRWIQPHGSRPLVSGKGIPTIVYLDLNAMKQLGIGYGTLRTAKICEVHDLDSALHLKWLIRHHSQPLAHLVPNIRIFRSRETSLTQSGHKIIKASVSGGKKVIISSLLESLEEVSAIKGKEDYFKQLLDNYEIEAQETVLWRFDINLQLELFS